MFEDRCLIEFFYVFIQNLYNQKLMSKVEFDKLKRHFLEYNKKIGNPDLVIILKCSLEEQVKRIKNRNRDYEGDI